MHGILSSAWPARGVTVRACTIATHAVTTHDNGGGGRQQHNCVAPTKKGTDYCNSGGLFCQCLKGRVWLCTVCRCALRTAYSSPLALLTTCFTTANFPLESATQDGKHNQVESCERVQWQPQWQH